MYGEKFALQNRLSQFMVGRQIKIYICFAVTFLLCFILHLGTISKYIPPGSHIRRGDLTGVFFALRAYIYNLNWIKRVF